MAKIDCFTKEKELMDECMKEAKEVLIKYMPSRARRYATVEICDLAIKLYMLQKEKNN